MPTVPAYVVIRTENTRDEMPLVRVQSRRFQNLDERAFFDDHSIDWYLVANPFYKGQDAMAMIVAYIGREDQTTVTLINKPRSKRAEAEHDLRNLVTADLQGLMSCSNVTLHFETGTEIKETPGLRYVECLASVSHGPMAGRRHVWYTIRCVDAHTV
jgi:hypothetical protein